MAHSSRTPRDVSQRSMFGHTEFDAELGPTAAGFIAGATSSENAVDELEEGPVSEAVSSVDGRRLGSLWEADNDELSVG